MTKEQISIGRENLYKQVWSKPMIHLAKEYGLSDNGLRKICKKLKVPTPPAGYWMRLKHGRKVNRVSLKPLDPDDPDTHIIERNGPDNSFILSEDAAQAISLVLKEDNRIIVSEKARYHHLVKEAKDALQRRKVDEYGMLNVHCRYLDIRVSRKSMKRALRILNALIKTLESKGFKVKNETENRRGSHIYLLGEKVQFCLKEKTKRIDHIPTKKEIQDAKQYPVIYPIPQWQQVPNGMLYLKILSYEPYEHRKTWSDGIKQRLELMLNDFIAGAIRVADAKRQHNREIAELHKKREEERLEREKEGRRIRMIDEQSELWSKSQRVRAYIRAVDKALSNQSHYSETSEKIDEWLSFARRYADYLDPIKCDMDFFNGF